MTNASTRHILRRSLTTTVDSSPIRSTWMGSTSTTSSRFGSKPHPSVRTRLSRLLPPSLPHERGAPLWVHLNVDYPFHLKGILYFPKMRRDFDLTKSTVQLSQPRFCVGQLQRSHPQLSYGPASNHRQPRHPIERIQKLSADGSHRSSVGDPCFKKGVR